MATFEVQTRITHKYLMRKSKYELTKWVLDELDRNDALRARVQELEAEARKVPILGAAVESLHKQRDEMGRIAGKALRELIDICGRSGGGAALAGKQPQEGE